MNAHGGWTLRVAGLAYCAVLTGTALAGGPRSVNGAGEPLAWPSAPTAIVYHPDPGPLGQLSNAEARALVAEAFAEWQAIGVVTFSEGALLGSDVNATGLPSSNPSHFGNFYRLDGDGLSPVIFDTDGSIIDALFGAGARFEIMGLGGLDTPIDEVTLVTGASIVVNGAFYDGVGEPDSPEDVSLTALRGLIVHEIGHFLNLDHSVVNHELALDDNAGNDIYVPTMFPIAATDDEALASLNPDDVMALRMLYDAAVPVTDLSGSVLAGVTPFQGAQVVLRRAGDPLMQAYGVISGGLHFPCMPGTACDPCTTSCPPDPPEQGAWSATHLPAGSYSICLSQVDTRFALVNDTFVGPLAAPPILPGPEECWTAGESGAPTDNPDAVQAVSGIVSGIDIVLNTLPVSDSHEPNDTLGTGATLADLGSGSDTTESVLASADLDVFNVPVIAGQRLRVDIDAAELGSPLDAVLGFYDAGGALVALVDDAFDPDSQAFSFDPALELVVGFTGVGKLVVSSFPDLDQDGSDGATTGPYWIRVDVATDTDGDGAADPLDICPTAALDDADRDDFCFGADNCPTEFNPTQDAPFKISAPLVAGGAVIGYSISPDESRVVYLADQQVDEVFQLYSVPIGGGTAVRLNPDLGATAKDVVNWTVSSDGATVVYLADQDTDEVFELYSVPTAGGVSTKLSGTLTVGGDVLEFAISPDDSAAVFRADRDVDTIDELYSTPIEGGKITQLNAPFVAGGSIVDPGAGFSSFLFSADGSTVVYAADQDTLGRVELYRVPIFGGGTTKLNGALVANGNVFNFRLDTINARVLFTADAEVDGRFELYSVPLAGGAVTKISGTMPGGAAGVANFLITPDNVRAIYRADQDTPGRIELYSVPVTVATPVKLNATLVANGNVTVFTLPVGTEDGTRLIYRADQEADEVFELYSVPLTGGSVVNLNPAPVAGGDVTAQGAIFDSTPLWVGDLETNDQLEVWSASVLGGPVNRLSGTMIPNGDYVSASFLATKVAIRMDKDADEVVEVYGNHPQGGIPLKLNAPLVAGGDVVQVRFTESDPGTFVYRADQEVDERFELYARPFSLDRDADGVDDRCDLCPTDADAGQADADGNGVGDACDGCALGTDPDADAICNAADNCPMLANPGQADFDGDGAGDDCDTDDDDDGLADAVETDTGTFVDGNDTGTDPFDADTDGDGVADGAEIAEDNDPNDGGEFGGGVPYAPGGTITTTAQEVRTLFAADLDRDGDVDVLSASFADDTIAWHENDGASPPGWTQRVISSTADGAHGVFAADVDGDGDIDALSASVLDDTIAWYENDGASPPGWTNRVVASSADAAFGVFAADMDGDGDLDVLSASSSDSTIAWYENDGATPPGWTERTITTTANGAVWVAAADVDGDGDLDALSASPGNHTVAWYENDGMSPPNWTTRTITTTATAVSAVVAVDVNGDGNLDVVAPSPLENTVAWYESDGASPPAWTERVISAAAGTEPNSVSVGDIDEDGDPDVLWAATSGRFAWHENLGGSPPSWAERAVAQFASGAGSAVLADVDADGDLDALALSESTDSAEWYENRMIHRNAAYPSRSVVGSTGGGAGSIHLADVDGDGDLDAVSGGGPTRWHENLDGNGASWSTATVQSLGEPNADTAVADLDLDGDLDVLTIAGTSGNVTWAENTAGDGSTWSVQTIPHVGTQGTSVQVADIDGDGDPDVVTTMVSGRISWHENTAGDASAWTERMVASHTFNWDNLPVDLDRDGDMDLLNAGAGPLWYENTAGDGSTWSTHGIGGLGGNQRFLAAGDLDGDGDTDVLCSSPNVDTIEWYENTSGDASTWIEHTITTSADEVRGMAVADVDDDGDLDVASTAALSHQVVLYENVSGDGSAWSPRIVSLFANSPRAVAIGDVDGDGRADVAAAGFFSGGQVAWHPNRGGQFTLDTTSLAPGGLTDGTRAALLAVELTSNGRAGDSDVELATLELAVTDAAGVALSSAEGNALIERVRVYLDNGSAAFEPGNDLAVTTVETLALSPLTIEFAAGDPRVRVGAGESETFFVVADVALGASALSQNQFRLTHVTESSSKARDAESSALLEMEFRTNTGTGSIQAVADVTPPFVVGVFPPHGAVDLSPATDVVLFVSEPVDPASAPLGVTLSAGGIKVPGTVQVAPDGMAVSFDPESVLVLDQDYALRVTERLTDRAGNPAVPFLAVFDTTSNGAVASIDAGSIEQGSSFEGQNADDQSGFSVASVGDVNGDGVSDLLIGAPNADFENVDAGRATLVFGSPGLQSDVSAPTVSWATQVTSLFAGEAVARGGDIDDDGIADLLIGAPRSDDNGTDAGAVWLVFGDAGLDELAPGSIDLDGLASCAQATSCGVAFVGEPGDRAGASISAAGDVNGDGFEDLAIGAPGASPGGKFEAGRVYLVYGPLEAGTIALSTVGVTTPGLVFNGENAGDLAGSSVSAWEDVTGDGVDDLLVAAPGASTLDVFGDEIDESGWVYAVQGGTGPGHLTTAATPGVVELGRVANGASDQVAGVVFLGAESMGHLGRSITGEVDSDGNGTPDIVMSSDGRAFAIPGDGPKSVSGGSRTGDTLPSGNTNAEQSWGQGMSRSLGGLDSLSDFGGVLYEAGDDDPLTVGPAGDVNDDGHGDFVVGAPFADGAAGVDAGRAYLIYGSPAPGGDERLLSEVGTSVAGLTVEGAEAGDNLGASVGGGEDLNADGIDDALVGAPFADTEPATPADAGETYVLSPLNPDEVLGVRLARFGGTTTLIEWSIPDLAATYNVYRGTLAVLEASGGVLTSDMVQLGCGILTNADGDLLPDTTDDDEPGPGAGFTYLVTATNFAGEGPLGPAGADPVRINDAQCP